MDDTAFYLTLAELMKKKVLVDYSENDTVYLFVIDDAVIVKELLNLPYYASALILTSLVEYYKPFIKRGVRTIRFILRDFIYTGNHFDIMNMYKLSYGTFKIAIHQLYKRNYLERIDHNMYLFNYRLIPRIVLEYLLEDTLDHMNT